MIRKTLLAAMLLIAGTAANAAVILEQNFDDVNAMFAGANPWVRSNLSDVIGSQQNWEQGNAGNFSAQAGPANSYAAASFLNAAFDGVTPHTVSNWLISPTLTLVNGLTMTFFTRNDANGVFGDLLEVRASNDAGTDVSTFTNLLLAINPALSPTGYPADWTAFTVTFSGVVDGTIGRFAFRYLIPDNTVAGSYIGIDSVSVNTPVPEPGLLALLAATLLPLGFALRRK